VDSAPLVYVGLLKTWVDHPSIRNSFYWWNHSFHERFWRISFCS